MRAAFQSTSPMKTPWVRVVALTLAISVSFSQGWATFGGGGGGGMGGTLNSFPTNVTVDWKDLGFLGPDVGPVEPC